MPQEMDYEFGRTAVSRGQLSQAQLEECIEVMVALERVGSRQRLWDIVARKGYMTEAEIADLRNRVKHRAPTGAIEKGGHLDHARDQETEEEMDIVFLEATNFLLAHMLGDGKSAIYPLPMRMVIVGKDSGCDIVLPEPGVAERHIRITCGSGRFKASLFVPTTRMAVNARPMIVYTLGPNDLIELGAAQLLFLADYDGGPAPQPTSPAAVEGVPSVRLRIIDGPNQGTSFFLGAQPLVVGSHDLANVRLADDEVAEFHAHIACTRKGVRLLDLKSRTGIRVNGLSVGQQILSDEDAFSIGATTFAVKVLMPSAMSSAPAEAARPEIEPEETAKSVSAAVNEVEKEAVQEEEKVDWDISLDVEVQGESDLKVETGIKAPEDISHPRAAPKAYAPGELQLTCLEGPLEGRKFVLKKTTTIVGRAPGADILIHDSSVSRRHAEFVLGTQFVVLRDLKSRNGIFVNGARVSKKALRSGDTIRIGECLFIAEEV